MPRAFNHMTAGLRNAGLQPCHDGRNDGLGVRPFDQVNGAHNLAQTGHQPDLVVLNYRGGRGDHMDLGYDPVSGHLRKIRPCGPRTPHPHKYARGGCQIAPLIGVYKGRKGRVMCG